MLVLDVILSSHLDLLILLLLANEAGVDRLLNLAMRTRLEAFSIDQVLLLCKELLLRMLWHHHCWLLLLPSKYSLLIISVLISCDLELGEMDEHLL